MSIGLLLIRLLVGGLLIGHGTQKLFGWWGGPGLAGAGGWFDSIGHRPGRQMAAVASLTEIGGGGLLCLGLVNPLGAAMVIGVMTVAGAVHRTNGLWNANGGFELPLTLGVVAAGLGFAGPGRWSIDHAAGLGLAGWAWGLGALVVGVLAGLAVLVRSQRVLRSEAAPYPAVADVEAPAGTQERITR